MPRWSFTLRALTRGLLLVLCSSLVVPAASAQVTMCGALTVSPASLAPPTTDEGGGVGGGGGGGRRPAEETPGSRNLPSSTQSEASEARGMLGELPPQAIVEGEAPEGVKLIVEETPPPAPAQPLSLLERIAKILRGAAPEEPLPTAEPPPPPPLEVDLPSPLLRETAPDAQEAERTTLFPEAWSQALPLLESPIAPLIIGLLLLLLLFLLIFLSL